MGTIAGECIREFGRQATDDAAKRLHLSVNDEAVVRCIVGLGPLKALRALSPMLIAAATGGVEPSGEAKPVPVEPQN